MSRRGTGTLSAVSKAERALREAASEFSLHLSDPVRGSNDRDFVPYNQRLLRAARAYAAAFNKAGGGPSGG